MKYGGLEQCAKWINWYAVPKGNGKTDKIPCSPQRYKINAHDVGHHKRFEELNTDLEIGYVFDGTEGFFFIDIDNAYDGQQWNSVAVEMCQRFAGCFIEVSQSGTGLHIIGLGTVPPEIGVKGNGFDLYRSGRFIALTGINPTGSVFTNAQAAIDGILRDFTFNETVSKTDLGDLNDGPVDGYTGEWTDDELIQVIIRSEAKNPNKAFGNNAAFKDLWSGDAGVLSSIWASDTPGQDFDHSRADLAFCSALGFWTGNDHTRIDRLMRASGLMRDKWDKRADYRKSTLLGSVSKNVFSKVKAEVIENAEIAIGTPYLTINQMLEVFKEHVYITELNKVFDPSSGLFLDQQRFNAVYGGCVYCMDEEGRNTSTTAWNIVTKCQRDVIKKASRVCFRPMKPYGLDEGIFNIYRPIETKRVKGDAGPFLYQIGLMFPDPNDRKIIISYMAAIIQHKGVKFSWAPVIQGVQGNGKTFINDVLLECIGDDYATTTKGESLGKDFNAWMMNKIFIGVEEVYYNGKDDLIESLKPIITNKRIQIEKKGVDKIQYDNVANFILNTNHKDAIRKTSDDRRYAVFYTAQQAQGDLARCGMTQDYFFNLFNWVENCDGYAIVNDYLSTFVIEDAYNPAKMSRTAPITSSYQEAITNSMTGPEQAILEAVENDTMGFRNGIISSVKASDLLARWRIAPKTLSKILEGLGYLKYGRFPKAIAYEDARPTIWIKSGMKIDSCVYELYMKLNYA